MPEATEEEWQHRIQMRCRAVQQIKSTPEYRVHCERKKEGLKLDDLEPKTPDPADRTVSKRTWKYQLHQWRLATGHSYREDCPVSVASTEECNSLGGAPTEEPEGPFTVVGDSDCESGSGI